MLLLDITTFEVENSAKILKRLKQVENMGSPKGLKIVDQWFDASGGRVVTLYDVETVKDYATYNLPLTDMCQVEVFPVVGADEFRKFTLKSMKTQT